MSEMVERVARALCRSKSAAQPGGWIERHINENWPVFMDDARTAIEAMREPTEAMLTAAHVHGKNHAIEMRQAWRDMIDEVLK
jgi:hypothetical protein